MKFIPVILMLLWVVLGFLAIVPALMSCMMFDSPQSTSDPFAIVAFLSIFSFPLVCLLSVCLMWGLDYYGHLRGSIIAGCLPLINIITVVILFAVFGID